MGEKNMAVDVVAMKISLIRGKKVMLDRELAGLYGVKTKTLNQAVRRNQRRFPEDCVFQLTKAEWKSLRPQIVTLNDPIDYQRDTNSKRGKHLKYMPYAFTETDIQRIFEAIKKLIQQRPPEPPRPRYGLN